MSTSVLFVCLLSSIVWVTPHPLLQSLPMQALLNNNNFNQPQNVAAQIPHQHHQHASCQQTIQQSPRQHHISPFQQQDIQQKPSCQQHGVQQILPNMKQVVEAVLKNQGLMFDSRQPTQMAGQPVPQITGNQNHGCHSHNIQNQQPQNQNVQTPQVVNNYFVLPPELFLNGTQKPGDDTKHNVEVEDVCKCEKEKDAIVNIEEKPSQIDAGDVVDMLNGKKSNCHVSDGPKIPLGIPDDLKRYYEVYDMIKKARKQKQTMGNSCHCNGHKYGRPVNAGNYPKENSKNHVRNLYGEYFNPQGIQKVHDNHQGCQKKEANSENVEPIGDPINFVDESQLVNENRKTRNPSDDTIVNNIQTKYPMLPEAVVRTLLSDMKSQLMKQQKTGCWNPYGAMVKNLYPMMPMYMAHNMTSNMNIPWYLQSQKQGPKVGKGKRKHKNNSGSNIITSKNNTELINSTNTEQIFNEDSGNKDKETYRSGVENSQLRKPKLFENTTPYGDAHRKDMIPALGTEDSILNIDKNDINSDDYNPDFSKSFDEDYYYDDDETERSERDTPRNKANELRQRRREYRKKHGRNNLRNHSRDRMTQENAHKVKNPEIIEEEKIVFKIPPSLEIPDFQTVKVNSRLGGGTDVPTDRDDTDFYDDYYPIFYRMTGQDAKEEESEAISAFNKVEFKTYDEPFSQIFNEEIRHTMTPKPKPDKIETSHADSKIVNYSQKTGEVISELKEESYVKKSKNGDRTIVVANTVKHSGDSRR